MELSVIEERDLRLDAARMGAEMVLIRLGLLKDEISQNEAFRLYTRAKVESWLNLGYIQKVKGKAKNSPHTFSRMQLETIHTLTKQGKLK